MQTFVTVVTFAGLKVSDANSEIRKTKKMPRISKQGSSVVWMKIIKVKEGSKGYGRSQINLHVTRGLKLAICMTVWKSVI